MWKVNETRFIMKIQHELCDCKYGLNESICNSKQKRNHDECRWKCKELDDWSSCKDDYMGNPSMCDWECNKACKIEEFLDIKIAHVKKVYLVN